MVWQEEEEERVSWQLIVESLHIYFCSYGLPPLRQLVLLFIIEYSSFLVHIYPSNWHDICSCSNLFYKWHSVQYTAYIAYHMTYTFVISHKLLWLCLKWIHKHKHTVVHTAFAFAFAHTCIYLYKRFPVRQDIQVRRKWREITHIYPSRLRSVRVFEADEEENKNMYTYDVRVHIVLYMTIAGGHSFSELCEFVSSYPNIRYVDVCVYARLRDYLWQ